MGFLDTAVDPRTQSYLDARTGMLAALAQLETALDAAREGGGERAVTRHHARGKLLARERIELLVDRDSPLLELSPVAGWGTGNPVGAGVVTAIGVVEDLPCMIIASDPTVRGGTIGAATLRKLGRAQTIAYQNRLPVICLIETTGYEQTEHSEIVMRAGRVVAGFAQLAGAGIPSAGALFSAATELGEIDLAGSFDYLVAVPPAGAGRATDHLAEDERDALRLTRQCVLRFRTTGEAGAPGTAAPPAHDQEDLLAIPATEPREILGRILDGSEFDELRPGHPPGLHTGWGSLHGHPVAILAGGGAAPDPGDVDKAARLIRHAEATRTPLLLLRHGAATPVATPTGASVPVLAVRVGDWHGRSAVEAQARFRFAWPNAHAAPDTSALQLSGQLDDDGVIDPRDTRTVLGLCLAVISGSQP
jgi:acetyl-CoA carboxylase carboxyltransferase component